MRTRLVFPRWMDADAARAAKPDRLVLAPESPSGRQRKTRVRLRVRDVTAELVALQPEDSPLAALLLRVNQGKPGAGDWRRDPLRRVHRRPR